MIVGDDVCPDVVLTASLPSCDNSQPSLVDKTPGEGIYDTWCHLANKGSSKKAPLHLLFFQGTPAENDHSTRAAAYFGGCILLPFNRLLLTFCRLLPVLKFRVLSVSALPSASLSPPTPTRLSLSFRGLFTSLDLLCWPWWSGMRTRGQAPLGPAHRRGPGLDCASRRCSSLLFPPLASSSVKQDSNPVTLPSWEVLQKGPS